MQPRKAAPLNDIEFANWKSDPTTKKVLALLQAKEDEVKIDWIQGKFTEGDEDAYQRGFVYGMWQLLRVPFEIATEHKGVKL